MLVVAEAVLSASLTDCDNYVPIGSHGYCYLMGPSVRIGKDTFCASCKAKWVNGKMPESAEQIHSLNSIDHESIARNNVTLTTEQHYPTLADMVANFAGAMGRIVKAAWHGKEVLVAEERFRQVLECCDACHKWDGTARHGLGKCSHPGCGCTVAKLHLSTEKCPAGGWDNADPSLPIVCPFPKSAK